MDSEDPAKYPDSNENWRAIDIFVFSNGQQYSPPRKYHLQAEDIELWKSTLAFLARTQYGPYHSTVELFTTRGRRLTSPLELSHGESYVAVQPPDCFIHAGYDKYLLKASRSWEKRQSKIATLEAVVNQNPVTMTVTATKVIEDSNIKSKQASAILKKASSSVKSQDPSTIINPQPTPGSKRNFVPKQTEKRKSSLQAPFFVRKLTPTLLPSSNLRNPFKRGDSTKSANSAKPAKQEVSRNSSASSRYSVMGASKTTPKIQLIKPTGKSKDGPLRPSVVLPRLSEIINEIKVTSISKLATKTDEKLFSTDTYSKNTTNDDTCIASALEVYKNPRKEMASIAINPHPKHSLVEDPIRQNATIAIVGQVSSINLDGLPNTNDTVAEKEETTHKVDEQEGIKINHKLVSSSPPENKLEDKVANDQNNTTKASENIRLDFNNAKRGIKYQEIDNTKIVPLETGDISNKTKMYDTNLPLNEKNYIDFANEGIKDTMSKLLEPQELFATKSVIQDIPPRKRSVTIEQPEKTEDVIDTTNVKQRETNRDKDIVLNTGKGNETLKLYNSSHRITSTTNDSFEEEQSIIQKEPAGFSSPVADKLVSDQYKATIRKGDVVNLKLNIQIESRDSGSKRHDDSLKSQSVTFIQTEKESQNMVDEQLILQNKSLLTLIGKELREKHTGDNHKIIIVQCGNCKYCNNHSIAASDNDAQKSYIIMLPIEKLQLTPEICRCHCGDGKQDNEDLRVKNVLKQTNSCVSLGKISKCPGEPDDTTTRIYMAPEPKSNDNENIVAVVRKKSVAINEGPILSSREPSIMTQEIDVKSELMEVSVMTIKGDFVIGGEKQDVSTQTDWCDLLLEAKLQPNGMYSFLLPSLELLKAHNLT